jgi:alpha,alpha-trehalase
VSNLQRHVNAAIAYNVWRYHEATGDIEFLSAHGAEMLVEIARFWASIVSYDRTATATRSAASWGPTSSTPATRTRTTPGLDNNAYTNVMAAWVLRCAAACCNS